MFKNLSAKNKMILLVSISLFLFMLLMIFSIYFSEKKELSKLEKETKQSTLASYNKLLKDYEYFYKNRIQSILETKGVAQAIKNEDRLKLHSLLKTRWEILKKENENIKILHFHKADGFTLLRMHNPAKYDDNIAQKREMCSYMKTHQKAIISYEAGVHLLGFRIMIPIFYDKKYYGAIEIGVDPKFILERMKYLNNVSSAIFAKEEKIYDTKFIDKSKKLLGEFRLNSHTLNDDILIDKIPLDYDLEGDLYIKNNDVTYAVYLLEQKNFKGDISAKTLIYKDISNLNDHFNGAMISIITFSILLYIVLLISMQIGFKKIINKVDSTNKELEKNIAFLKSHQLAMDESSIVTRADLKGNITYVNENFCKITGYTEEESIGKPHSIVRHENTPKEVFKELWETISAKKVWKGVLLNKGKKEDYWVDISILPILDENNEIVEYIAIRHDITKMIKQQQKLDNIANTDAMTGLGSRYKLTQDILNSNNPAIAIVNVDRFSQINDFYGNDEGDKVIYLLGFALSEMLAVTNYKLYHLQGDEFVILNSDVDKDEFIERITQIITHLETTPIELHEEELFLNLGTAISFEEKKKLLTTADMALKIAKKENKNIVVYNEFISLNDEYENNMKWAKKVKQAIEDDNIVPVFQPIVNNTNHKWEKYESLVRLKDKDTLISPYYFLEISKKTKYYTQITKTMIYKTFEVFKNREEEFSINLTIEDILNEKINQYIVDMLENYRIGSRVVFEIVESESIENFESIHKFIEIVKSHGCKIAIDDFGTGYSNFEYLLKLKADYIKIDGSMIKDIDTNEETQLVVSTIVEFAKKMDMKTIAEFVENESILNKIKELGIDYSQGYYFSKPEEKL